MLPAVPTEAADVKELFAIDLADYAGKEGRMIEVSYPPGAQDIVHRHDAHAAVSEDFRRGPSGERDRLDRDEHAGDVGPEADHRPRRLRPREELGIRLV